MQEVYDRIWVAGEQSCRSGGDGWAVVHACKDPCHRGAVGYQGSLSRSHPNYLSLLREQDLFLNLIDPPKPLFMPASFDTFLEFADREWRRGGTLLIHCNQGESRAPSLALLFLAKRRFALDDNSYATARDQFSRLFPKYRPGTGIQEYLSANWAVLGRSSAGVARSQ